MSFNEAEIQKIQLALEARDRDDSFIDKQNRKELSFSGLEEYEAKKRSIIDSGKIEGIEKVVDRIMQEVEDGHRIITIDGLSGSGKSSTARALARRIDGLLFSMGEIFRYLTYLYYVRNVSDFSEIFKNLDYRIIKNRICLFDGKINITFRMESELRDKKLESKIPEIAKKSQVEAIQFMSLQIRELSKELKKKIIIEGRAFTLDYLPTDLQISLTAGARVRAERRSLQRQKAADK